MSRPGARDNTAAGRDDRGAWSRPGARDHGEAAATLATEGLSVSYRAEEGDLPAVRDVTLDIRAGEAVGVVGESGSGKTTFALGAIGYLPGNGRVERGAARLHDVDLVGLRRRQLRHLWGSKIGLVSQDPETALNPTLTIGRQLDEMGHRHLGLGRTAARQASLAMLGRVHMPDPPTVIDSYPHQLSGGMVQRCVIGMALLTHPDLLILDEPTTALDVTTQALILDLLADLRNEFDLAILYITHNLGVVSRFCDRVAVMYAGEVFEEGAVADLFGRPLHPYTANLLHCIPRLEGSPAEGRLPEGRLATLPGNLPSLTALPRGCIFAPRCPLALEICTVARPPLVEAGPARLTACLRWKVLMSDEGQRAAIHTGEAARPEQRPGPGAAEAAAAREAAPAGEAAPEGEGAPSVVAAPGGASAGAGVFVSGAAPAGGAAPGAALVGAGAPGDSSPLCTVVDAVKDFPGPRRHTKIRAVDAVSLALDRKQTFGLVGESGSGKTTLARIMAGLTAPTSGKVFLEEDVLPPTVDKRDRAVLRRLQMVFQSPDSSLNPRHTVRQELMRPLIRLGGLNRHAAAARAAELLLAVRLPPSYLDRYPGELSGGEKQRVGIARAFASRPSLVICDEPLSSLDVSVQGALMNLLLDLQGEAGTSYFFISHDLAAVQHLSHLIGVMYLGKLVEQGEAARVLSPPYHPYTAALLAAVPEIDLRKPADPRTDGVPAASRASEGEEPGRPSGGEGATSGCPFHRRCPRNLGDICSTQEPPWRLREDGNLAPGGAPGATHAIRCHIPYEELGGRGVGDTAGRADGRAAPGAGAGAGEAR